jgi:hypothetical protein
MTLTKKDLGISVRKEVYSPNMSGSIFKFIRLSGYRFIYPLSSNKNKLSIIADMLSLTFEAAIQ